MWEGMVEGSEFRRLEIVNAAARLYAEGIFGSADDIIETSCNIMIR